jgi:GTPase SAR1 family protein
LIASARGLAINTIQMLYAVKLTFIPLTTESPSAEAVSPQFRAQFNTGAMLVFSIVDRNSFETLDQFYDQARREFAPRGVDTFPMVLVGTKCDLAAQRLVTEEEAREKAQSWQGSLQVVASGSTNG